MEPSMRFIRTAEMIRLLAVSMYFTLGMQSSARAGDDEHHYWVSHDPSVGYAVSIQHVYQFPAAIVFQPTASAGYAVPIQHVYQFPAPLVFQPGPESPFRSVVGISYDQ
jgi:hypothetical protein